MSEPLFFMKLLRASAESGETANLGGTQVDAETSKKILAMYEFLGSKGQEEMAADLHRDLPSVILAAHGHHARFHQGEDSGPNCPHCGGIHFEQVGPGEVPPSVVELLSMLMGGAQHMLPPTMMPGPGVTIQLLVVKPLEPEDKPKEDGE